MRLDLNVFFAVFLPNTGKSLLDERVKYSMRFLTTSKTFLIFAGIGLSIVICYEFAFFHYHLHHRKRAMQIDLSPLQKYAETVPRKKLPQHLLDALLSVEDPHFFRHHGVNYPAIIRTIITRDYYSPGANTITQQISWDIWRETKDSQFLFYTPMCLAHRIERELDDKEIILQYYIDNIDMGNGLTGIEEAAQYYFKTELNDLTRGQFAGLVGMMRNPYYRDPERFPDAYQKSREYVLQKMADSN